MRCCVIALGLLVPVLSVAQLGNSETDYVPVGDVAYGLVLPVQAVASGHVTRSGWSPSGAYVVALRLDLKLTPGLLEASVTGKPAVPPPTTASIVLYNAKTQKSSEVFKRSGPATYLEQLAWVNGVDVAYATLREPVLDREGKPAGFRFSLVEVDAPSGRAKVVLSLDGDPGATDMHASPSTPQIYLGKLSPDDSGRLPDVFVVSPGSPVRRIPAPQGLRLFGWTQDGLDLLFVSQTSVRGEGPRMARLSLSNGGLSEYQWVTPPPDAMPVRSGVLEVARRQTVVPGMSSAAYLRSVADPKAQRALIAMETEFAELSPKEDAVLYITRGVALVRPIARLPRAAYEKARDAALRTKALSQVKQVGLACLMYATDNNDVLIGGSDNWQDKLYPYCKNRDLFDGFTFTFQGGDLSKIDNPPGTELGYVFCPGGRAVVYVDGHAKFVPDK